MELMSGRVSSRLITYPVIRVLRRPQRLGTAGSPSLVDSSSLISRSSFCFWCWSRSSIVHLMDDTSALAGVCLNPAMEGSCLLQGLFLHRAAQGMS
jgi:hypothetical protein